MHFAGRVRERGERKREEREGWIRREMEGKRGGERRRDKGKGRKREGNGREGVIIKAVGSGSTSTYMCIYI